jgi:serine/threonine-protein kinase
VNQVGHPNIVDIFAFGALPDGRFYFVMEWLRGESLRDRLARAAMTMRETFEVLDNVAVALEAAHEKGIVHRDLKPDNVFVLEQKKNRPLQVKLLDFGIAKLLGGDTTRTERTQTGNLLGTPAYISPEQARGQAIDHRTDIYALGAVAFEMMTGELPFPATNAADMLAKHLYAPPPSASAIDPRVPPDVDALVTHMLAKDAHVRPALATVRAVLEANRDRVVGHDALPARPTGAQLTPLTSIVTPLPAPTAMLTGYEPPQARRGWILALGVLAAIGVAVAVFFAVSSSSSDEPAPPPPTAPAVAPPAIAPPTPPIATPTPAQPLPAATTTEEATPVTPAPAPPIDAGVAQTETPKTAPVTKTPAKTRPPSKRPPRPTTETPKAPVDPDAPM